MITEFDTKRNEFRELVQSISQCNKELSQNETEINNFDDNLDDYCSKLNELEHEIESLEEEKKSLAQKKKFKDAKRVKDSLIIKVEKRDNMQTKIVELKKAKEAAEDNILENKQKLKKLSKKKQKQEIELRHYEYDILWFKRWDLKNSMGNSEEEKDSDIIKILDKEIIEFEEKYGFSESLSESGDESRLSIEPPKAKVEVKSDTSDEEAKEEVQEQDE